MKVPDDWQCCAVCPTCKEKVVKRARARATQWTTTPPTEPGWYWAHGLGVTEVVQVTRYKQHHMNGQPPTTVLVGWVVGSESEEQDLQTWSHWQRIEAPEVPK